MSGKLEKLQHEVVAKLRANLRTFAGKQVSNARLRILRDAIERGLSRLVKESIHVGCGLHVSAELDSEVPDRLNIRLSDSYGREVCLNEELNRLESYYPDGTLAWCFPDPRLR